MDRARVEYPTLACCRPAACLPTRPSTKWRRRYSVFVATFAGAMLATREVHDDTVPAVAIVVAYVLIIVSTVALIPYVHRVGQSLGIS